MRRNERALSRAATQGDLRTYLAANKAQCQLLQLSPPAEQGGIDVAAARHRLEEELAWAICEAEPTDEGEKS